MEMTSNIQYTGDLSTSCNHLKSGTSISIDAPLDNNGKGETFSPTDLVATALASCMITVMGIKAEQDSIPFKQVSAHVLKVMSSGPRRISKIEVEVVVSEKWTEKQRVIMERTGLNCPVAKSLHQDLEQAIKFTYK